ncbi:hypothetical protein TWF281_009829 [Arthrobotrys megalospora]
MKFAIVALVAAAAVNAELVFDDSTGTFKCLGDAVDKSFCAGASLSSNIIIRCNGEKGQPGNCNDNLAGVPPIGVKSSALCWQSSNTTGDAGCSFQGIVHAEDGTTFPIPGYSSSSSSSAPEPTYGATTTAPEPTYGVTTTEPGSSYYPTLSWSNTTSSTYYPPPSSSTLITVTGTTTVTSCDTTTTAVPTKTYAPPPPNNTTSTYTTGLPRPTQSPSSAGTLLAKDSLVLGVVAFIGFMFL